MATLFLHLLFLNLVCMVLLCSKRLTLQRIHFSFVVNMQVIPVLDPNTPIYASSFTMEVSVKLHSGSLFSFGENLAFFQCEGLPY